MTVSKQATTSKRNLNRMRAQAVVFALVIVILVGGSIYSLQQPLLANWLFAGVSALVDSPVSSDPTAVQFTVTHGETTSSIADRLERQKLIGSTWTFTLLAKLRGVDQSLEAGVYTLRRNMTPNQVIDALIQGNYTGLQLTFLEGWRAAEMANLLESESVVPASSFTQAIIGSTAKYDFLADRPTNASLEGYLFPDTYRVPPGTTAQDLVDKMLQNFGRKLTTDMRQQALNRGMTIYDVVTLASIVEREAAVASERPIIAGVFLNRLKKGMPLQADPTVQYARANQAAASSPRAVDYWPKGLTTADLQIDSPYNTYLYKGLPPGPICNPGLASLKAVLEAGPTEYLYFVAKSDGTHVFASTLDEHNANVAKYQGKN